MQIQLLLLLPFNSSRCLIFLNIQCITYFCSDILHQHIFGISSHTMHLVHYLILFIYFASILTLSIALSQPVSGFCILFCIIHTFWYFLSLIKDGRILFTVCLWYKSLIYRHSCFLTFIPICLIFINTYMHRHTYYYTDTQHTCIHTFIHINLSIEKESWNSEFPVRTLIKLNIRMYGLE